MQSFYFEQIKSYENMSKNIQNQPPMQQWSSKQKPLSATTEIREQKQWKDVEKTAWNETSQQPESQVENNKQSDSKVIKKRRRKNILPSINPFLQELLSEIAENRGFLIEAWKKRTTWSSNKTDRASKYVGVSKNGANWQVLININYSKKYVGTYPTEKQAAIVYDFYSIAHHGSKAKTNFSYKRDLIADMIQYYLNNENEFCPESFESRVE